VGAFEAARLLVERGADEWFCETSAI